HLLDLGLLQAAGSGDGDALLATGGLVLRGDVQNAVRVDVKGYLNLRDTARRGRDAVQNELAKRLVVLRSRALTLHHVDLHLVLVVSRGAEDLALRDRDRGVALDNRRRDAAQRLDAERQRRHVEQQHVLDLAAEHARLDRRA